MRPLSVCGNYYFDEDDAQRYVDFFPAFCKHLKGELRGKPVELLPWFRDDVVRPLFGWKRVEDDFRRYTEAFVFVARKNSKTLGMAGLGLALTAIDGEPGAEIYCLASTEEQAKVLFNMALEMIKMSPALQKIFPLEDVQEGAGIIKHRPSGSFFRVLSGTEMGKTGTNPHVLIVDEYHEFKSKEVVEAITTGMAGRRQPLVIYITTAGKDTSSPCFEEYQIARGVKKGTIDNPEYLPVLYEPDPEDDWTSEETWRKANPGYGLSVKKRYFEAKLRKARMSVVEEIKFKQFHCNQWQNKSSAYIKADAWTKCRRDYTAESLLGKLCWGGLDLADTQDLNSFALLFPEWLDDGKTLVLKILVWYWVPKKTAEQRAARGYSYPQWIRDGLIEETEGNRTDTDFIKDRIVEISKLYKIHEAGFDPYNANTLTTELVSKHGLNFVEVRQGSLTMNGPIKEMDIRISRETMLHNNNAVLNWNISNATIERSKDGNIKFDKSRNDEKIDGAVAVAIALERFMRADPPRPPRKMRVID